MEKGSLVESLISGRERRAIGEEHRTEITEVTAGIEVGWRKALWWRAWFLSWKDAQSRRTSHREARGPRQGSPSSLKESDSLRVREKLLTFHGTGGEACHDPVLEDHDQDDQWDCHHHGSCHDRAPGLFIRCCTAKL
jgi:hypothetical protein